jgi:hypothetical protein
MGGISELVFFSMLHRSTLQVSAKRPTLDLQQNRKETTA